MAFVVHYVGGPRDGHVEPHAGRPPYTQRHWSGQGEAPVDYTLLPVGPGPSCQALVYAASWLPEAVVRSTVAARLRHREHASVPLTRTRRDRTYSLPRPSRMHPETVEPA